MTTELTPGFGTSPRSGRSVRWGIPDAALVWVGAGVAGVFAALPVAGSEDIDPTYTFGVLLPVQQLAVLAALVLVSRAKGQSSLRADFGLEVRAADIRAVWLGPVLQVGLWVALVPLVWLGGETENQRLVEDLEESTASVLPVALFILGAVVIAPVAEETLYRGLLLRALLRRVSPASAVFVSSLVFASVHFLGDPNAFRTLPALTALGVVLGVKALRTGSLSVPILIHAGFNLTTTVLVLLTPEDLLG